MRKHANETDVITKLSWGQIVVLALAAVPMAAVGIAGGVATYANMSRVLPGEAATALGMVAAGEGATLIAALVALAVTLMGQHTPTITRVAMWLLPVIASVVGVALAPEGNHTEMVIMGVTPLAMTVAGEGVAFVARRVVARRTGVDLEQQRRAGLLVWHTNRAQHGNWIGRRLSTVAVWRLTREFATTDPATVALIGETIRLRITQGADANLAAVLTRTETAPQTALTTPLAAPQLAPAPVVQDEYETPAETPSEPAKHIVAVNAEFKGEPVVTKAEEDEWIHSLLNEAETAVATDDKVQLMSTADVAQVKGVGQGTVRSWKQRGRLVPFEIRDGRPLYHPNDVAKLV